MAKPFGAGMTRWRLCWAAVLVWTLACTSGSNPSPPGMRSSGAEVLDPQGDPPTSWLDAAGRPSSTAHEALAILRAAASDGLNPDAYHVDALTPLLTSLDAGGSSAADGARFEATLTASMQHYLRHLHSGRINPRTIGFRMTRPADGHDFVQVLQSAIAKGRISDAVAEATPPLALYRGLRSALARYRELAATPANNTVPEFSRTLRPGENSDAVPALRRRLTILGDLPAAESPESTSLLYDAPTVEAVKRFQTRHGLDADGAIGRPTQAAIRVPLAWRVRQIELALERLRWLPHLDPNGFIGVNIPMFHLWVWNSTRPDGAPSFDANVIVGRALDTQTPVFVEEMTDIVFRPYWNVPASILRNEILPAIERNPTYLSDQHMEIVAGQGDDARPVPLSRDSLDRLRRGTLRVRQRPGPDNALGLLKFDFPNNENVYMHSTPAPALFSRTRRDFSHGCIRVDDPVGLAEWALKGHPEWTRDRILEAMGGTRTFRVALDRPIQVILFYVTAVVMPGDGTIHFAEDIYKHDEKLDRALSALRIE